MVRYIDRVEIVVKFIRLIVSALKIIVIAIGMTLLFYECLYAIEINFNIKFDDVSGLCIAMFTSIVTIVGVFESINAAYQQYHFDLINRVRPFLSLTHIKNYKISKYSNAIDEVVNDAFENPEELDDGFYEYIERKVNFIIRKDGIECVNELSKEQRDTIIRRGLRSSIDKDNVLVYDTPFASEAFKATNVGNGAAVNTTIEIYNKKATKFKNAKHMFMINKDDSFEFRIYCDEVDKVLGNEYYLVFSYQDILGNTYEQRYACRYKLKDNQYCFSINLLCEQQFYENRK